MVNRNGSTNGNGNGSTNGTPSLTAEDFLKPRKSQGYKVPSVLGSGLIGHAIDDRPLFTWMQADRMRRDPQVDFGLRIIRTPVYGATWDVACKHTKVSDFVHRTLMRFWQRCLRKVFRFFEYGVSVGESAHKLEGGLVQLDRLDDFHPRDTRPLEFLRGRQQGNLAGIRLRNVRHEGTEAQGHVNILPPHAWWFSGESEYGGLYSRPRLAGAYEPWLEKRGRNGATDSRRLWYKKCAFRGGVMRHPPGMTDMGDESASVLRSNQDIAREICEKFENGGILALLNTSDEKGNFLWSYEPPASHPDVAGLREYPKDLDREILIGLGIPPELVEAAVVGSGYSGRAIPAQVFFTSIDEIVALILETVDRQIVRPLVRLNFGPVSYHVLPRSLASLVAKEPDGTGGSGQPKGGDGADLMGKQQGSEQQPSVELSEAVVVDRMLADRVKALAAQEYPDLPAVELSNFDESKVKRDHGQFASKPGAKGAPAALAATAATPAHGSRAAAIHAKHQELRQARIDTFNEVKADAETAKGKAESNRQEIIEHMNNIASVSGSGDALSTAFIAIEEIWQQDDPETPAELFQQFKEYEAAAKDALKANAKTEPGNGDDQLTVEDLAENDKRIKAVIQSAKAGREQLRTYAQHRKEMKAIRDGEPLELSFAIDGDESLDESLNELLDDSLDESLALSFDESKVSRDGGKFASRPGASGASGTSGSAETPTPKTEPPAESSVKGKFRAMLSRLSEVPGAVRRKATDFVVNKYKALETKYGRPGAISILTGMVLLSPTPIPGSSLIPIALASAVQKIRRKLAAGSTQATGTATATATPVSLSDGAATMTAETLAGAIREAIAAFYPEMGEQSPAIKDEDALKVATQLLGGEVNLSDAAGHEHKGKGQGGGQFVSKGGGGGGSAAKTKSNPREAAARVEPKDKVVVTPEGDKFQAQAKLIVGGKLKPSAQRAFNGKREGNPISGHLAGAIGEEILIQHLKDQGFDDAGYTSSFVGSIQNNIAFDLIHDHQLIEAKTGQASNTVGVWALKYDGRYSQAQEKKFARMTPERAAAAKKKINQAKVKAIHERKQRFADEVQQQLGYKIKTGMMTVVINHDTQTADIYQFDGLHDSISWNSEMAKKAYVKSVKYG